MNGPGFTETLSNPNPGELRLVMRLPSRSITIWQHSQDEGDKWNLGNVYIGKRYRQSATDKNSTNEINQSLN